MSKDTIAVYQQIIDYAKSVHFCCGCPIDMSIEGNYKTCHTCEHRKFYEFVIHYFRALIDLDN